MGFIWFSEKATIISLNSINQVILVTVKSCVFFDIDNEFLNTVIIYIGFGFK
jgi:hypothetical protein